MGLSQSGKFDDQLNDDYQSVAKNVSTSEVLMAVGGSNISKRQELLIYNDGPEIIFIGPTGVSSSGSAKGIPVEVGETFNPPGGDGLDFYAITASGTSSVIIQEMA